MAESGQERIEDSELERQSKEEAAEAAVRARKRARRRPYIPMHEQLRPYQMFVLFGGFALYALMLAAIISEVVPPIVPFAALLYFLYPFRRQVVVRRTIQLAIFTFVIWLALNLAGVLLPFIVAFGLAYLFSPLVGLLERKGIPRWATTLAVVFGILGVYALIGIFVIPRLIDEFNNLLASSQVWLRNANSLLDRERLIRILTRYGVSRRDATELVTNQVEPQIRQAATWLISTLGDVVRNVSTILEGVINLILIPLITFYLILDFDRIRVFVRSTLLLDRPKYVSWAKRIDTILSAYIRGILLTSSLVGALATAILLSFDIPYAIVIGILTGVFNLIPSLGIFINLGVAMIIYLFAPGGFWYNTLVTAGMVLGLHAFNGYVVEPRIIGDRVGLHPMVLIASLFIFSHFLGFIGLLVAVPASAIIIMFLKEWYQRSVAPRRAPVPPAESSAAGMHS